MILEIRLENFYSIKDEIVIDFEAGEIESEILEDLADNYFLYNEKKYLKSLAIYGANAAGKSNILKAIHNCHELVTNSHLIEADRPYNFEPFKLDPNYFNGPSKFFIRFVHQENEYAYNFVLNKGKKEILSESLIQFKGETEKNIFSRDESKKTIYQIDKEVVDKGKDIAKLTRKDVLFLSNLYALNSEYGSSLFDFFTQDFVRNIQSMSPGAENTLFEQFGGKLQQILEFADSDITNIEKKKVRTPLSNRPNFINNTIITDRFYTRHKSNPDVVFDFLEEESAGTIKFFYLMLNFLFLVANNKAVIIDELESSLHPKLVEFIISFFHQGESPQMLFSTHNTHLLDMGVMRKDQILFANKKNDGSTELYSLYDFEDWGDERNPELDYLNGRFDAVPQLRDARISLKSLLDG